ncbi:MAG: hypothetical protein M3040_03600 [Bacteroidota bacterium]|nr:hypothetical protein [Bacteroidota bacterium]
MKKSILFFTLCSALIAGCTSKELNREEAFKLIKQGKRYPRVLDYDLYCGDPEHAKKVLDAGLEAQGLLTVQRTQKLREIGSPLIHFTKKAQGYFLATPESDKSSNIQKLKLADEELVEVTGIKTGQSGKDAVVEYSTTYKNLTPFSVLVPTNFKQGPMHNANFTLYDDGWRLEK